jgi:hypothetical protein
MTGMAGITTANTESGMRGCHNLGSLSDVLDGLLIAGAVAPHQANGPEGAEGFVSTPETHACLKTVPEGKSS